MVDYTNPVTTTFALQRQSIRQGQQALEQTIDLQQRVGNAVIDGLDTQKSAQQQGVDLQQAALHAALDTVETTVPGSEKTVGELRETVDEQYEELLANHETAFATLVEFLSDGVDASDDLTAAYVDALDEQVALALEAHEALEAQAIDAVEGLGAQIEELQEQLEAIQHEVQDASEQAVPPVEA
jgi:chromosome segregation ATPase